MQIVLFVMSETMTRNTRLPLPDSLLVNVTVCVCKKMWERERKRIELFIANLLIITVHKENGKSFDLPRKGVKCDLLEIIQFLY